MPLRILLVIAVFVNCVANDRLTQIILLGRHNIRTPDTNNDVYSSKDWFKWAEEPGHLTTKGALLEEYLGDYFSDYFMKEKLVTNECPDDTIVHVYANSMHRTRKSAKHFVRNAFRGCGISINLQPNVTDDPLFETVILNDTDNFGTIARKEIQEKLDQMDVHSTYVRLNEIIDIGTSDLCKLNGLCDLTEGENNITLDIGREPNVFGPFKVAYEIADEFLMAYYNGEELPKIGWGLIQPVDLSLLMNITRYDQKLRYSCPTVAKSVALPLLSYIEYLFLEQKYTISILVGDDSNINSVLTAIGIKPYELEGQNEISPLGGKVLFEKWYNGQDYYMKIKYAYLATDQIRNGFRLSASNPVHETNLELNDVEVNEQGYCTFVTFMRILENLLPNTTSV